MEIRTRRCHTFIENVIYFDGRAHAGSNWINTHKCIPIVQRQWIVQKCEGAIEMQVFIFGRGCFDARRLMNFANSRKQFIFPRAPTNLPAAIFGVFYKVNSKTRRLSVCWFESVAYLD